MHFWAPSSRITTAGCALVFAIALVASAWLLPGHILIDIGIAASFTAAAWWWLYHFEILRKKQTPNGYQAVAPVHNSYVSAKAVDRVRNHLLEGEEIHDIRRKSVWHFLRQIRFEVVMAVVLLVLMVMVGGHINPLPNLSSQSQNSGNIHKSGASKTKPDNTKSPAIKPPMPGSTHVPSLPFRWWYLLVASLIPVYLMYRKWLFWASWFIIYTRERLLVVVEPFAIYPFYKPTMDDEFPMTGALKVKVEVSGNTYAKKWGNAVFSVATIYSDEEEAPIRDIVGLPDPDSLKARIDTDIRERDKALAEAREERDRQAAEANQEMFNRLERVAESTEKLTATISEHYSPSKRRRRSS